MDTGRLERVLIIKPSSLGDIIHALPVASSIKSAVPGVHIDWVAGGAYTEVLEGNPSVDRIITFDRSMLKGRGRAGRLLKFIRELRRERYDIVIDLQGLIRSALMAWACRAGRRAGFANAREGAPLLYNIKVHVGRRDMHAVDRYLLVPEALGIRGDDTSFRIAVGSEHERAASELLSSAGIPEGEAFVAVAPSARWETKRWDASRFVAVAGRLLRETGVKSVFVGTRDEAEALEGLEEAPPREAMLFGKTGIKTLAALLGRSRVLLTNDSGPMHIAAAVGTPVVAVFGPTDPGLTGPYGVGNTVVTAGVKCAPCFRRDCGDVKCLTGIKTDEVYDAVRTALRG